MFSKLKDKIQGLVEKDEPELKPKESIETKVKKKIKRTTKIKEKDIDQLTEDLKISLLSADVSLNTAEQIVEETEEELINREIKAKEDFREVTLDTIKNALERRVLEPGQYLHEEIEKSSEPYLVLFLGPNGHGKTTTIAKFAYMLQEKGMDTVLAAADTFRAASIEQIQEWADKLDTKLIKHEYGSDPAAVCYDTKEHAEANDKDAVLIDTAGRSELDKNLMQQLEKIKRVTEPDYSMYVTESVAGNAAVEQAKRFEEKIGIDGLTLTKTDTDAKGGCLLSISNELNKPIQYIGTGQNLQDLEKFKKKWFIDQVMP